MLSEVERRGGPAAERRQAESVLSKAREAVDDPALPARLAGAKARVRDLHAERQRFVVANLPELVTGPEQDAAVAVEAMLAAASVFLDAYNRREQAATVIGQLASAAGPIRRGAVGPGTRAEAAARELARLIEQGEPSPTLLVYPVGDVPEAVPA